MPLTLQDVEIAQNLAVSKRKVARGRVIRREGDEVSGVFFLMEGWVGSSIMLRNGRRQIVKLHLPGDMLGFPSLALLASGESLEALTDTIVSFIPNTSLGRMFTESPRLAIGLF
ncbi:cyclic nucleotide-binding domain-containing protein [Sphingobium sp.]|uniref:Crp/Fnr family transcriptional regulator n=1 Tax=Sphingobium sp. TaxID=1912891 RepID=UPI002D02C6B5|nr:cyclic nucleotide-binding domain-containing protein [Sphingobium sp.]HUD93361.1 cyclic nucleotide-binding domain-containing protein [Sphingobium sp.]